MSGTVAFLCSLALSYGWKCLFVFHVCTYRGESGWISIPLMIQFDIFPLYKHPHHRDGRKYC